VYIRQECRDLGLILIHSSLFKIRSVLLRANPYFILYLNLNVVLHLCLLIHICTLLHCAIIFVVFASETDCCNRAMQESRPGIVRDAITGKALVYVFGLEL